LDAFSNGFIIGKGRLSFVVFGTLFRHFQRSRQRQQFLRDTKVLAIEVVQYSQ